MSYAQIPVDFDVWKEITARRDNPGVSENDILRKALGLSVAERSTAQPPSSNIRYWISGGVTFAIGTQVRHRFRGGAMADGVIGTNGVVVDGKSYAGFSPAAMAAGGTHANGWNFWEVEQPDGRWIKATALRR